MTRYDISASRLYSITGNTRVVVNALEQDVTIYWVVQSGQEDKVIENLLEKYDSLSGHIRVVKKNPDIYSYSYSTSFDGEGAITSAIDYVVSETLPPDLHSGGPRRGRSPGLLPGTAGKREF